MSGSLWPSAQVYYRNHRFSLPNGLSPLVGTSALKKNPLFIFSLVLVHNSIKNALSAGLDGQISLIYLSTYSSIKCIAAAAAKSPQSCLTLCDPIDGSPPGSSIPGILQARTLEWVAIFFSNACIMLSHFCHVWFCVTLCTAALQVPPSTGFSRQEYWSGLPFPFPITCINHLLIN